MLSNILNLKGVTVLDKNQQAMVKGGEQCFLRITEGDSVSYEYSPNSSSSGANDHCLAHLSAGADRCQYDCDGDGFTASWLE
jgi:hypothetical protein